jgi:hypothetical protein
VDSRLISLRASPANPVILLLWPPHIGQASQSIPSHHLSMRMIRQLKFRIRRKEAYQRLVGSLGWLLSTTRPDIAAAHSFISSYSNKPASGHMKAELYVLHYIQSTHDYGISFTSKHSYVHYPPSSKVEAYKDAIPPSLGSSNTLSAYSDACWVSQLGSSVADGTLLPLFKFRSA